MVPLNYNQLYYFYKIAELGSIAEASKNVLISSPALSMQLKELEETLGSQLFDRVGKKLILTDTGSVVFEYAKDIFKLGLELKDTINDRTVDKRLRIEIGCQDSIPKKIVDELLAFLLDQKKCRVVVREGDREQLIQMQNSFQLDLILTNSVPSINNDFIYESKLLLKEDIVISGSPALCKKIKTKKLDSLKGQPFILPTFDTSLRQKIDTYFTQHHINVDCIAEVEDMAMEIDLAIRGFGFIATIRSAVNDQLKNKNLIEVCTLKDLQDEVWMIVGKRKIINPLALFALKQFKMNR
ncbi:MAG: LysR family transcriptional regulator [Bacteriovoracaceae bacterium]